MGNRINIKIKICPICGKEYKPARETTIACSRKCSSKVKYLSQKQTYICDFCGKEYLANKYNNSRSEKNYCSLSCRSASYWDKNRKPHKIINNVDNKECSTCKEWHPLNQFNKDSSKWDKLGNVCNECYKDYCRNIWSKTKKGVISRKKGKANRRSLEKKAGNLTSVTISEVFNENIKLYGELTCIYCKENCSDSWHLEHKTPLCRGGMNNKENLAISCPTCNLKKARKTSDEFINRDLDAGDVFGMLTTRDQVEQ